MHRSVIQPKPWVSCTRKTTENICLIVLAIRQITTAVLGFSGVKTVHPAEGHLPSSLEKEQHNPHNGEPNIKR